MKCFELELVKSIRKFGSSVEMFHFPFSPLPTNGRGGDARRALHPAIARSTVGGPDKLDTVLPIQ